MKILNKKQQATILERLGTIARMQAQNFVKLAEDPVAQTIDTTITRSALDIAYEIAGAEGFEIILKRFKAIAPAEQPYS